MSMLRDPSTKYSPFPQVPLTDRQWPTRTITAPPRWLSTDLRDGNQAIVDPMDAHKKTRFFDLLVDVGALPRASCIDPEHTHANRPQQPRRLKARVANAHH